MVFRVVGHHRAGSNEAIVDGVTRMMGHFLARFWPKKLFLAVRKPQFSLPRPPRDVFWSPLSSKNRFGPGSTKKMTRPISFSDQFSFFWSFLAPCDPLLPPFLALKWPRDPSKKIRAEISYPMVPVRRQETPWVRFYGQISEKNRTHFWLHHPGTPTTLLYVSSNISWALESRVPDTSGFYVWLALMDFD